MSATELQAHRARTRPERLALLARLLGAPTDAVDERSLATVLEAEPASDRVWLVLAVLRGELPTAPEVTAWRRRVRLDGAGALLALRPARRLRRRAVRVVEGGVVVDVHHTVRTDLETGIQRVVVGVMKQWTAADRAMTIVGWTPDNRALEHLGERWQEARDSARRPRSAHDTVVPWRSTYVLPELAVEETRLDRLQALAQSGAGECSVVGYDCVPLTVPETAGGGMPGAFARNLATVAWFDRVATISEAAAVEYRGWSAMVAAAGITAPRIASVLLADEPVPAGGDAVELQELVRPDHPLVLCVGSHEPRKNHLAVLHAAELAWSEGHDFDLLFVGGNAWNSTRFLDRLAELQRQGRPVRSLLRVDDVTLAALYRRAAFSVFPSLNEGYGLPIVESLALGTPVITSAFGSMREIATAGCVLVDPRDDRAIAAAIGGLLTDDVRRERLAGEARERGIRSWEAYADELWSFMVNGGHVDGRPQSSSGVS
ncbi:glycosyltransferase [Microcella frigidaquae]|uniref:Glycosyltransferase involved in cell wall biosynthesis n=1 Tax=Microcella frigidaquae TaxID=424758 RepID=A0A840XPN5_9MICO|nr:glycosyltransferase involved in cell wall biosynthesis [Microcella frigidaquae]NHN44573.1 glycosyltransferase family 4 protein [Microcella frigidaquae]